MIRGIVKPAAILTAVVFVCVYILSHVERFTGPVIVKRAREKQDVALALVLPGFAAGGEIRTKVDGRDFSYWKAEKIIDKEPAVKGYAFITRAPGYGGDVETMVGVDEKGAILGLSVINQSETPGLGARSIEIANRETLWDYIKDGIPVRDSSDEVRVPWFQVQFKGLNTNSKIRIIKRGEWNPGMREQLIEKNAISAITGATITSTAVVACVEEGMVKLKKALSQPSAGATAPGVVK